MTLKTRAGDQRWQITCEFIEFDGQVYGISSTILPIFSFSENRCITELRVYPLKFHKDPNIEARLTERGARLVNYQSTNYVDYTGVAYDDSGWEREVLVGDNPTSIPMELIEICR